MGSRWDLFSATHNKGCCHKFFPCVVDKLHPAPLHGVTSIHSLKCSVGEIKAPKSFLLAMLISFVRVYGSEQSPLLVSGRFIANYKIRNKP